MKLPTLPVNYKRVLRQIKVGADNPITGAEIALTLKLEERTVQKIISQLITRYGIPIVGVRHGFNRGYFIPEDKTELLDGAKSFYNQLQDEQKRLNVLMNAEPEEYKQLVKQLLEEV
ncbi:HTH domain-containing protein [Streptococcus anginosus]|uniref:HTH domain-containing protein n=1 Tax=Streptococcus anginosus TaxID=1328 RepID=A0A6G4MZJ8_STRAP|nr:HTH domain-containing protein [Streptococcus anginosus]MCW0934629.1 helix-turn-helix domain-containing protein [Streptococcus anginosus]MCW0988366.1 helix-turn-helix domain-containing protein [Streptococcus anginosus]MCW1032682.1 helix-turn-helix domain-containing protein [Streptococcus anginosus]MCW1042524.1 helix-turn-helix domain-containing protein [Streptococcus anginosus]MCW1068834.1 helix-turn-helix domain-containing protein [Streptococcus anginosus]